MLFPKPTRANRTFPVGDSQKKIFKSAGLERKISCSEKVMVLLVHAAWTTPPIKKQMFVKKMENFFKRGVETYVSIINTCGCINYIYIPLFESTTLVFFSFAEILKVFRKKQCGRDPMLGRFLSVRSSNCLTSPRFGMEKSCPHLGSRSREGQLPSASRAVRSYDPTIDPGFTSSWTVQKK